jgi:hypothetical protein
LTGSELWPEEGLEAIHQASLHLLQRAGLRVWSEEVRVALLTAGCTPGAGDRVLVPRGLLEQALATCPDGFGLADDILGELCRLIDVCAREIGLAEWLDPRRLLETSTKVA